MGVEIDRVALTLRVDATITLYDRNNQPAHWIKPGSEAMVSWRGGIPSKEEIELAYKYLNARNTDALQKTIEECRDQLKEHGIAF